MLRMSRLTAEQRRQMGLAGRKKMGAEFDKKAVVKATVDTLKL